MNKLEKNICHKFGLNQQTTTFAPRYNETETTSGIASLKVNRDIRQKIKVEIKLESISFKKSRKAIP